MQNQFTMLLMMKVDLKFSENTIRQHSATVVNFRNPSTSSNLRTKFSCRIWSSKNPQVIEERPLHLEKLNVW